MASNNKENIRNNILEKIKSGQIAMKPKWHFILKAVLGLVGIVILALSLIYLTSFLFFILRLTGVFFAPSFGFKGVGLLLASLPWVLVLLAVIFVILLEVLVRKYAFAYQRPLLYSLVGIVALVALGSLLTSRFNFHNRVFLYAEKQKVPLVAPFYRQFGQGPRKDINPGVIKEFKEGGLIISSPWGEDLEIGTNSETRLPYGADFKVGDRVVVMGRRGTSSDSIRAFGIRKVEGMPDFPMMGPGGMHMKIIVSAE